MPPSSQPVCAPGPSTLPVLAFGSREPPNENALPPFSQLHAPDPADPTSLSLQHLARTVAKAKRIAVVCGAGISCASGIPDFRSTDGLFESLKKQHPSARLSSGKDLFDASLFASEASAAIFYTMIAELKEMADKAQPTAFHRLLKLLDDDGKLFRVYTQNIDGLESKAGLSYGLGLPASSTTAPLSPRKRTRASRSASPSTPPPSDPSLPSVPRCIPLHGVLSTLYCPHCSHTTSIREFLPLLSKGETSACPSCIKLDQCRQSLGERSRGVGLLKPSVVLYGESHPDGERVGEITRRDLMVGKRPDLLLVVGTSLKVPGTKLFVRELAKVIRPMPVVAPVEDDNDSADKGKEDDDDEDAMPVASGSTTSSTTTCGPTRARRKTQLKPKDVHAIYLNLEFPTPAREFKDTFDVWARGDIQEFVKAVEHERDEEIERVKKRKKEKEEREMRKAEKERLASMAVDLEAVVDAPSPAASVSVSIPKTKAGSKATATRKENMRQTKLDMKVVKRPTPTRKNEASRTKPKQKTSTAAAAGKKSTKAVEVSAGSTKRVGIAKKKKRRPPTTSRADSPPLFQVGTRSRPSAVLRPGPPSFVPPGYRPGVLPFNFPVSKVRLDTANLKA